MPNNICIFGCNINKKLSVFSIPKDELLKNEWRKSLEVRHLFSNNVVCVEHFRTDQIQKKKDIFDKVGNIVCSVPLLRTRLLPNAVPFRFSARKKLKFDENTEKKVPKVYIKKGLLMDSNCGDKVVETSVPDTNYQCDPDKNIVDIMLDHNCSAKPNDNLQLNECVEKYNVMTFNKTMICQENMSTTIEEQSNTISFNELNTLDLHLPPNWHKYLSYGKKYFGISEIIFVEKEGMLNSILRKSIIISQSLKFTCNILGKNVCNDKLVNANTNIESMDQLNSLIKEVALLKVLYQLLH